MDALQAPGREVTVTVENVGGIDEADVRLRPGTNVLVGSNATNRTSLLQAIMAGLGSDRASLKGDADSGRVALRLDGETYTRTLDREDGDAVFGGEPYTDDPELADLFAFLLESNDARRAVVRGDDLREVIMRPVDTDAIEAKIDELQSRKRDVEAKLDRRDELRERREALATEREELTTRLETARTDLGEQREAVEAADAELAETREHEAELEAKLEELQDRRSALDEVGFRLETERETAERLRDELSEVRAALADLPETPTDELDELEARTNRLHERKRTLDSRINQLRALVQFNEEFLESETFEALPGPDAGDEAHPTTRLLPDEASLTCWTCGGETTRAEVGDTLDRLRERRQELVDRRTEVSGRLDDVADRKARLEEQRERREELEHREPTLSAELAEAESEIDDLTERESALAAEIERLDEEVEALREDEVYDEMIDRHRELNELQLEVQQLEGDRERVEDELASVEEQLDDLADLEDERSEIESRLAEERTRVERLETRAVETFNDHMEQVLDVLGYGAVERIWIERTEREVRDGRRTVARGAFDLHVVRESDDGVLYEDAVDHLSESEREVTGLVFALAGYLAHEVHEEVPFVLLDSVEAIDADRIPDLLDYLDDYASYLVVALLPEDAAGIDHEHHRITDI